MESPSITASVETLCDYILAIDSEQRVVRGVNNSALLMPIEAVMQLLHTSTREIFTAARQLRPFLPVDKTIAKLLATPAQMPTRGTLLRLLRGVPHQVFLQSLIDQGKEDFIWLTGNGWHSLLSSQLFIHQAPRDFWISFLQEATILNAVDMRSDKNFLARMHAYAKAPVVERFGCSTARLILDDWLSEKRDEEPMASDAVIQHVVVADRFAVLLRVLAWLVADMVVDIWEMVERDDMQDITPLESLLPAFDPVSSRWNNPTTRGLEQLAKRAGWQQKQRAITFLGNLWARHSSDDNTEASSRIRLLRNWEQRKKGRPKFETLRSLAHAVTIEQALLSNESPEGRGYDAWMQAVILRVGETLSEILHALVALGLGTDHITGVMDAYRQEYRLAREALGKPMRLA
ncbi:hypothetical protein [Pseudomonas syringae]|uniref:Uncharacterized protein n=1 Tax=Pseudomonas syringae TaxID=317 RepID=A0A085VAF1_PSESX|nr:hypothetical protein [Pseudomonas syringae]KFE52414.1 hypothetical protein IV02_08245 [Pseudomonas syringae]